MNLTLEQASLCKLCCLSHFIQFADCGKITIAEIYNCNYWYDSLFCRSRQIRRTLK